MAGISLSADDVKSLREVYVRDDGAFDFRAFIDDVNDHRSNGHFETHPVSKNAETKRQSVSAYVVSPMAGGSAGFFVPLTAAERGELQALLERLRHLCHTRGLVVKQFMHDYDENHIGLVTVHRFKREASALFPQLQPAEVDLLAKAYSTADRNDVRYMVLHNDVTPDDEAAAVGVRGVMGKSGAIAAERVALAASAKAAAVAAGTSPGGRAGPPSPVRALVSAKVLEHATVPADNLAAVEASIIRQVFERRIRIADAFADFDPLRHGIVTRSQFLRGLRMLRLEGVSPAGMEAVAEKYAVGAPEMESTMQLPFGLARQDDADLTTAQRAEALRERARGTEDTLRQGIEAQLASAAPPAGAFIRYTAFVKDVDSAWTEPLLEKDPTKQLDSFAHTVVTSPHPRFVRPELDAAAQVALDKALLGIRAAIARSRLYNLKPSLEDYDITCEGMVTETQFLRTLAMFRLVPETPDGRASLLLYFRGKGVKSHLIDYRAFLLSVYEPGMA